MRTISDCQILADHPVASKLMEEIGLRSNPDKLAHLTPVTKEDMDFIQFDSIYALSNFETEHL